MSLAEFGQLAGSFGVIPERIEPEQRWSERDIKPNHRTNIRCERVVSIADVLKREGEHGDRNSVAWQAQSHKDDGNDKG